MKLHNEMEIKTYSSWWYYFKMCQCPHHESMRRTYRIASYASKRNFVRAIKETFPTVPRDIN